MLHMKPHFLLIPSIFMIWKEAVKVHIPMTCIITTPTEGSREGPGSNPCPKCRVSGCGCGYGTLTHCCPHRDGPGKRTPERHFSIASSGDHSDSNSSNIFSILLLFRTLPPSYVNEVMSD